MANEQMTDEELRELQMLENEEKNLSKQKRGNQNDEADLMAELNNLESSGSNEISLGGNQRPNKRQGRPGGNEEDALLAELGMLERQEAKGFKAQKQAAQPQINDDELLMQELGQLEKPVKQNPVEKKLSPQEDLLRINKRLEEVMKQLVECKKLNKKAEVNLFRAKYYF